MKTVVITDLEYKEFNNVDEAIQVASREYYEVWSVSAEARDSISYAVHTITTTTYVMPGYGRLKVGYTPTVEAALKAIFEVKERGISEQYKAKYEGEIARLHRELVSKQISIIALKAINKLLDKVGIR